MRTVRQDAQCGTHSEVCQTKVKTVIRKQDAPSASIDKAP